MNIHDLFSKKTDQAGDRLWERRRRVTESAASGYKYDPYEDEDDDVRKIIHMVRKPDGSEVRVPFTPYDRMTSRDLELWIRLGMSHRPSGGNWDSESLEQAAAEQNIAEGQSMPTMDKVKMAYMTVALEAPLGTTSREFIGWWQNQLSKVNINVSDAQLQKLMREFGGRTQQIHAELTKKYGDYEGMLNYVDEAKRKPSLKNPADNPCWKGYHPVGTKKKNGRTVPNCVPKESVEEGSLNEVTQGVEHSEWVDNVKDAYYPTQVRIVKKRTEDGRHVKSVAMIGDKLVGQYNMNTGVGTFKSAKQHSVAESGFF